MKPNTNINLKKAFTMAEAILVMTILGIIATIMITTLKPAEFKDKGLKVLAKKVLSEIDTATTQILTNDTRLGKFDQLVVDSTVTTAFATDGGNTLNYYKKYLTTIRGAVPDTSCCVTGGANLAANAIYLKDGACLGIKATTDYANSSFNTIFPGELNAQATNKVTQGLIIFDTNGTDEPNTLGKDCFILPVGTDGIMYD